MSRFNSVVIGAAVFLLAMPVFSSTFFMEKPKMTGVSADDAAAIEELVRTTVSRQGGHSLVGDPAKADFLPRLQLIRLGRTYLLTLDKADHAGKIKYSSQMKAGAVEEFDTVANRLVRSVISEEPIKGDIQVGEVTESESQASAQRTETSRYWLVGFGPFALLGLGSEGVSYGMTIGYDWEVESVAAVKIFWDGVFNPNKASFNVVGLGGSYFFSEKKTAPLVSLDFGYGGALNHAEIGEGGFSIGGGPALRFFRTSKVNVEVQARFGVLLRQIDGSTPSTVGLHAVLMF